MVRDYSQAVSIIRQASKKIYTNAMFQRVRVPLRMRRDMHKPLPHARTELTILAAPAAVIDLHKALHCVRETGEIRLPVKHSPA